MGGGKKATVELTRKMREQLSSLTCSFCLNFFGVGIYYLYSFGHENACLKKHKAIKYVDTLKRTNQNQIIRRYIKEVFVSSVYKLQAHIFSAHILCKGGEIYSRIKLAIFQRHEFGCEKISR